MLVLEIVLVHLLLACAYALDLMCTLFTRLHCDQAIGQVHFTFRWNTSLAKDSVVQIGSSLLSSSFPHG